MRSGQIFGPCDRVNERVQKRRLQIQNIVLEVNVLNNELPVVLQDFGQLRLAGACQILVFFN